MTQILPRLALVALLPLAGCLALPAMRLAENAVTEGPGGCKYDRGDLAEADAIRVRDALCGGAADVGLPLHRGASPIERAVAVVAWAERRGSGARGSTDEQARLAAIWDVAMRTDPAEVTAGVEALAVPAGARKAFVARYRQARQQASELAAALGDRWHAVFVAPALAARTRRAAADRELAPWLAKVQPLIETIDRAILDGSAKPKWVAQIEELRRAYVAACQPVRDDVRVCLADPVGRPLAELLSRLGRALGDLALVRAEDLVLAIPSRVDPGSDEYVALEDAVAAERAAHEAWSKARAGGVSDAPLAERWPVAPLRVGEETPILIAARPRGGSSGVGAVAPAIDVVRTVMRRGDRATIAFRRRTGTMRVPTGCRETKKIQSISASGLVIYQEHCSGSVMRVYDHTVAPVEVAAAEAAAIKPGELAEVTVDPATRRGYVVRVRKVTTRGAKDLDAHGLDDGPIVQLRAFRLTAVP